MTLERCTDGQSLTNTPNQTVSPDSVAVSLGSNDLCTVHVTTHEGAEYIFPDMSLGQLRGVMPESGRIPADMPSLMMVNISIAVLTMPFRVIKTVEVKTGEPGWDGEILWASPA